MRVHVRVYVAAWVRVYARVFPRMRNNARQISQQRKVIDGKANIKKIANNSLPNKDRLNYRFYFTSALTTQSFSAMKVIHKNLGK